MFAISLEPLLESREEKDYSKSIARWLGEQVKGSCTTFQLLLG